MAYFITTIHIVVSLFLIVVVLLQSGKAADLAGAFGGMGSQTVFGPRGSATVLTRATTVAAVLFMLTSLTLSVISTDALGGSSTPSILQEATEEPATEVPATGDAGTGGEQTIPSPFDEAAPADGTTPADGAAGTDGTPQPQ